MKHIQTFTVFEAENGFVIRKGQDFGRMSEGETEIANDIAELVNLIAHEVSAKTSPRVKLKPHLTPGPKGPRGAGRSE